MARNIDKYSKVKIFVGYHKPNVLFCTEVYQPILTADIPWENQPNVVKDSTGTNIADKNKHYGELTGHYWVWKNFLPKTKAEYIGFCHYRRFLDFNIHQTEPIPFKPVLAEDFKKMIFPKYTSDNISRIIDGYDIVLPNKFPIDCSVYEQYLRYHPKEDLDIGLKVLDELYPEYSTASKEFMESDEFYNCIHFVMKKELFNEYMGWLFNILQETEKRCDWSKYTEYMTVRTPAFLAERFLNIWLLHNIKTRNLKVLNSTSLILTGEGYGSNEYDSPQTAALRYMIKVQQLKIKGDANLASLQATFNQLLK